MVMIPSKSFQSGQPQQSPFESSQRRQPRRQSQTMTPTGCLAPTERMEGTSGRAAPERCQCEVILEVENNTWICLYCKTDLGKFRITVAVQYSTVFDICIRDTQGWKSLSEPELLCFYMWWVNQLLRLSAESRCCFPVPSPVFGFQR